MNYFYTFKKDFFRNFHSNLSRTQAEKIYNFIKYNFLDKENFYLKMERTLLETKFGEGKVNDIFNHLKKKISNEIIESYESRNLPIDFTFTGNKNKVSFPKNSLVDKFYLNCDFILKKDNDIKIEKYLTKNYLNFWLGNRKQFAKRNLHNYLTRVCKSSDRLYFIDRMIAATAIDGKDYQYRSYKNTFEFLNSVFKANKNKYNLISSVSIKQKEAIEQMTKKLFVNNLNIFLNKIVDKQNNLLIKEKAHQDFHQRYIIVFLDKDLWGVYQLSDGDILNDKYSTEKRNIHKKGKQEAEALWGSLLRNKVLEKTNIYAVFP